MTLAQMISIPVIRKYNIPIGSTGMGKEDYEYLMSKPINEILLDAAVASPILEETLFRAIPSFVASGLGAKGNVWEVGIPTSAVFALVHNIGINEDYKKELNMEKMPLYQFAGGLFYWYLMRERGFTHSVVAHSANNAVAMTVAKVFHSAFSPDQKTGAPSKPADASG